MLMHQLLIDGAARRPDQIALRWVDRDIEDVAKMTLPSRSRVATDRNGHAVVLFSSDWELEHAQKENPGVEFKSGAYEAAEGVDALVIITEWDQFRALDLDRLKLLMKAPVVVDLRNVYKPAEMVRHGLTYASIGRG